MNKILDINGIFEDIRFNYRCKPPDGTLQTSFQVPYHVLALDLFDRHFEDEEDTY